MRSSLRATLALFVAAVLLPATTLTATAAEANDTPAGAVATLLGETYEQDTTAAQTEPSDADLNDFCGAPAVRGSVWYTYTSDGSEGVGFLVDGTGTNYDLGLMIFEGTPTADSLVACGPMKTAAYTTLGETYYIMAFTANADDLVGGNLTLQILEAPEAPTASVTVDSRATAYKDGSVRLTGTYTCTDADYSEVFGTLTQRVGRMKITGDFYATDFTCDGDIHLWEAYATSGNGFFAGGKAANLTFAFVCGALECADGYSESTIQLSRSKK